jgi:hypothetical protein
MMYNIQNSSFPSSLGSFTHLSHDESKLIFSPVSVRSGSAPRLHFNFQLCSRTCSECVLKLAAFTAVRGREQVEEAAATLVEVGEATPDRIARTRIPDLEVEVAVVVDLGRDRAVVQALVLEADQAAAREVVREAVLAAVHRAQAAQPFLSGSVSIAIRPFVHSPPALQPTC